MATKKKKTKKKRTIIFDEIFKNFLFIASIAAITYFLHSEVNYQYKFEVGKPWQNELLTATFDFPIYKTEAEIEEERSKIIASHTPYFDWMEDAAEQQIALFRTETNKLLSEDIQKKSYLKYFETYIRKSYETGLVSQDDYKRVSDQNADFLYITKSKISEKTKFNQINSTKTALETIKANFPKDLDSAKIRTLTIASYLVPNLIYNSETTSKIKSDELNNLSITSGMVQTGERIIGKGEIIDKQKFKILNSLQRETTLSSERKYRLLGGRILLVTCLMLLFYLYTRLFRKDFFKSKRFIVLILLLITSFTILTALVVQKTEASMVYIIPYTLLPIIVSTFFDTRTGLFAHIITILLSSLMVPLPFDFVLLQITSGMIAMYSLKDLTQRSQLARAAIIIVISYCLFYFSHALTLDGDIVKMDAWMFVYFIINGVLLLLAHPFIYIIEKTFGFISNVTLIELSNINNPLLRKLSQTAPGTFQHSMQVSNLATEIAIKVDANPLLARTGALYHDIGKIRNSAFFTENQAKGNNPHDTLKPEESAQIILRHVTDGLEIAKSHKLPKTVSEFIDTHHGKNTTKYFYTVWQNEHPNEEINDALFSYPGPNPYTKEQGIVMICDAVEAASRSLPEYTSKSIDTLVERIIDQFLKDKCLNNAPLTLKEITLIKIVLKEKLKSIYYTRVAYPKANKK